MTTFDRHAFIEAREQAILNSPRKGLMDKLILRLTDHGFGASHIAEGWRTIKQPEQELLLQLELGEPIQPDRLTCIILNDLVPTEKYFPLAADAELYDSLDIDLSKTAIEVACEEITAMYVAALESANVDFTSKKCQNCG